MAFQDTVLGPALWNAFFVDVVQHVPIANQEINLFADDLPVMTHRALHVSDGIVLKDLDDIQYRTHEWGMRNQVELDPSKEYLKIIHPARGLGDDFKLLGIIFDEVLSMMPCIQEVLQRIRAKVRAIPRSRHLCLVNVMLHQYKAHD